MIQDLIHSNLFWPVSLALIAAYYVWVGYSYFWESLKKMIKGTGEDNASGKKVTLSWDDLTCGFSVHRKLLVNPNAKLEPFENELLAKTPFKELIRGTFEN